MSLRPRYTAHCLAGDDGDLLTILRRGDGLRATAAGLASAGDPHRIELETGGSTGAPKIVRRSVESWRASSRTNAGLFDIDSASRVGCLGALSHSMSLYAMCEAAHLGAALLPLGGQRPDRQMRILRDESATHLWLTPTQLHQIARFGPVATVRVVLIGGGALNEGGRAIAQATFPNARIVPFYGTSEASFITLDGKPYPGVEIDVARGAIRVRSPLVFKDYLSGADPHVTRDGGWLSVGERGRWDAGGRLEVLGRLSRVINVSDRLISPERVEAFLTDRAGETVVVMAQPDDRRGNILVAFRAGPPDADRDAALLRAARRAFGPQAAPRRISLLPELPTLPSGKPDLRKLEQMVPAPG